MSLFLKFLVAAVAAGTPLLFGTVGEILNEKVGHLNLGVEGMMALGACAGFMTAYLTDSLALALLASFAAGVLASLISRSAEGTLKLPAKVTASLAAVHIPGLSDAPVVGELLFSYNVFVYLGVAVALAAGWYLYGTKTGLNVQAIGENPGAADAASIPVNKFKYINLLLGGGICGIGGAYCSMIINGGVWLSDSVGGLGWIAVALVIFAAWKPQLAILGSFVFGGLRVLKYYVPTGAVPIAFFDMLPFLMTALVLIVTSMRGSKGSHIPASLGVNYFREDR